MTCDICCEEFNKSLNKKISCPIGNCDFESCKTCVRKYILSISSDPCCMKCKSQWNQIFVTENLNKSFMDGEYKEHRTKLLTDIEISKIPETMEYVENFSKIKKLEESKKELDIEIKDLLIRLNNMKAQSNEMAITINNFKTGKGYQNPEKKKFIMPCQNEECKGYLSSQYKCGICEAYTCPDCFEVIGLSKDVEHICNEDSIKTTEEIKKTTKPCPNCGQRIFKAFGCDQMWCIECKVAFNWNTGKIVTNNIHNPHYYEYIQKNGILNRNVGDVPCGGLIDFYYINNNIFTPIRRFKSKDKEFNQELFANLMLLVEFHRLINHITNQEITSLRNKINSLIDQKELRAKYILNNITLEEYSKQLYNNDKIRKKNQEMLYIYELVSVYGIEFFRNLTENEFYSVSKTENDFKKFVIYISDELMMVNNLINYFNYQMAIISVSYNFTVKKIHKSYLLITQKYNLSELKIIKNKYDNNTKLGIGNNNHEASSSSG